jgi:hypothetical protein
MLAFQDFNFNELYYAYVVMFAMYFTIFVFLK